MRVGIVALLVVIVGTVQCFETIVSCTQPSCIRVGFTYSDAGTVVDQATEMKNGFRFWAEYVNSNPINSKYGIELIAYADGGNATRTRQLYKTLVVSDNSLILFGPYGSSLTRSAILGSLDAQNSTGYLAPFIFAAVADDIFGLGYNHTFGISTPAGKYIEPALRLLGNALTVSFGMTQSGFTNDVWEGAREYLTGSGAGSQPYFQGTIQTFNLSNANRAMKTLEGYKTDVVMLLVQLLEANPALNEMVSNTTLRPKAMLITSGPCWVDWIATQSSSAYLLCPNQWFPTANFTDPFFGKTSNFAQSYLNRYPGNTADYISAGSVAVGEVLQLALQHIQFNVSTPIPLNSIISTSIIQAISQINTTTQWGKIAFDNTGKNIAKDILITQVTSTRSTTEIISPNSQKTASLAYPMAWAVTSTPSTISTQTLCRTLPNEITWFGSPITVCLEISINICQVTTKLTVSFLNAPITTNTFSISDIKNIFQTQNCGGQGACNVCPYWSTLDLDTTGIHACFAVNVSCILPTQSFDVGCFEDSTVFDRCFAHCPNNCNFRGTCDNGFCSCDSPYGGTDCSSIVVCPNNCTDSLHGSCDRTNGVCQCTTGFGGADCSVLSSSIDSSSSSRAWVGWVIAVVVIVLVVAVILVGIFIYRRTKKSSHSVVLEEQRSGKRDDDVALEN